ncbi:MAG: hypothetical protein GVY28_08435, partial [Alphaproteobacteria bacterium]|nr:hypothetical protein [Alphaproteobacteria bacterium]
LHVPEVELHAARVRFAETRGEGLSVLGAIDVAGRVEPSADANHAFDLSIVEIRHEQPRPDGLAVSGRFSLDRGTARAEVGGLAFTERYRQLLPRDLRRWWEQLDPAGRIGNVSFTLDPEAGWRALVAFHDVAMTLPQLTDADYRFRMTGVSGAFEFTSDGFGIVDELEGTVEDLSYRIAGASGSYDPNGPFRFALQTEQFDVPAEPRYIYALPSAVQEVFRMLTPEGRINISMGVWRHAHGQAIDYAGTATIHDGRGRYARFPYELRDCRGKIKFDPRRIKVLSLTGKTSGGGSATINGVISPPNAHPAVDLTVTAVNMPFDRVLYEALDPAHRKALDMFFHEPSYQRMRREGHFITVAEHNADEMALAQVERALDGLDANAPARRRRYRQQQAAIRQRLDKSVFDLGGRADVVVDVHRSEGPGDRTTASTRVNLHEASIVLSFFAYPLRVTEGTLLIDANRVRFQGVQANGLRRGRVVLDGRVGFPERPGGTLRPDLDVAATGVPIDEMLLDALPRPHDRWVRRLRPAGTLGLAGRIFTGRRGRPELDLGIDLKHVRMQPGGGDFALTDVDGRIGLSLHGVRLHDIVGRRDDSTVRLSGSADWADPNDVQVRLDARADQLDFGDPLLDLVDPFVEVDPRWPALVRQLAPAGRFDAHLTYDSGRERRTPLRVTLMPESFAATYAGRRFAFDRTAGRVIVGGDRVRFEDLAAEIEDGRLTVNGTLNLAPERRARLAVGVRGSSVSGQLKRIAPQAIGRLIETFGIQGAYDVAIDPLRLRPGAAPGQPRMSLRGRATVRDASASFGLPVTKLNGALQFEARILAGERWPRLDVSIEADRLELADRPITDFAARLMSARSPGLIVVPQMRGSMFDGAIGGNGSIDLPRQSYGFHLALSDVDLATFMQAGRREPIRRKSSPESVPPAEDRPSGAGDGERAASGRLSAAFSLEGRIDDPEALRARGDVQIRDGRLYDLPLSLGLLQVTHLSLPTARTFNRARTSYHMQDGRIVFERIALTSPSMRLAGEGSMDYTSGKLDLSLTSSNPGGLDLGPVTDLIDGFRNELVTIRVTGTLEQPVSEVQQLSGLTEAWQDVFGAGGAEAE